MKTGKTCRRCKQFKGPSEMKKDTRNKDGYSSFCKACHHAASVAWQKENPDKLNATRRLRYERKRMELNAARRAKYTYETMRWPRLKALYGVTREQYEAKLSEQRSSCAICGSLASKSKRMFAVDHDHSCCAKTPTCGKCNRGLLCHHCNVSLHSVERNKDWLRSVVEYLKIWEGRCNG